MQELLSTSFREKAQARCSPYECCLCLHSNLSSKMTLSPLLPSNKTSSSLLPATFYLLLPATCYLLHTSNCLEAPPPSPPPEGFDKLMICRTNIYHAVRVRSSQMNSIRRSSSNTIYGRCRAGVVVPFACIF